MKAARKQQGHCTMVSAADVAFYQEHGYLVVDDVLDGPTLAGVRRALADILEGARRVTQHDAVYDLEPSHRPEAPRVRRIKTPHLHFPDFAALARHPRLVDVLQALLGPAVRLHGSKINM